MSRVERRLRVNPIRCDGFGYCAELLPELIAPDEWGFPIVSEGPVPAGLEQEARLAVASCPRLALALERPSPSRPRGRTPRTTPPRT